MQGAAHALQPFRKADRQRHRQRVCIFHGYRALHAHNVRGKADVVIIRFKHRLDSAQGFHIFPAETHLRRVVVRKLIARTRPADRIQRKPAVQFLCIKVRIGNQLALLRILHPLRDRKDGQRFRDHRQNFVKEPIHTEARYPAYQQVGAGKRLLQLFNLVIFVSRRNFAFQGQVFPRFARMPDDLPVERRPHQPDFIAVVARWEADGRSHHSRSYNCNNTH
ncbi:MAG: hypothetical protein DELT_03108 [Desulfovibrio sp.]